MVNYLIIIKMICDSDVFIFLFECVNIVNVFSVDYFILFYINSGGGIGFESYIYNVLFNSSIVYVK